MTEARNAAIEQRLRGLGVTRGVLIDMAQNGQLLEVRCEMPYCYHASRRDFDERSKPPGDWELNFDHYPTLDADGGERTPGNARLAHVYCNRTDLGRRLQIRKLLDDGESLQDIADFLNRREKIRVPNSYSSWTPGLVRRAQIS
jgi:hypothetical protein